MFSFAGRRMSEKESASEEPVTLRFFDYVFASNDYPYKKKLLDEAKRTKSKTKANLLRCAAAAVMTDVLVDVPADIVESYDVEANPNITSIDLVRFETPLYHRKLYVKGPISYVVVVSYKNKPNRSRMIPVDSTHGRAPLPMKQPFHSARPLLDSEYDHYVQSAMRTYWSTPRNQLMVVRLFTE